MRLALAIYAAALRLYPRAFVTTHGDELCRTFEDVVAAARRTSVRRFAMVAAAEVWNVLAAAVAFRWTPESPRLRRNSTDRGGSMMLVDDLRHALRRLRAAPATAALVAAMLALAIGVTSAMFTVADHMLFNAAPFRQPDRLAWLLFGKDLQSSRATLPRPLVARLQRLPVFGAVSGVIQGSAIIEGADGIATAGVRWVTPGTFEMLGVAPILGRTFVSGEGRAGTGDLAIISEALWRSRLGADAHIIGREIRLSGQPVTVVGVMPAGFTFPHPDIQIWRPFDLASPPAGMEKSSLEVYARLADGVPAADAARVAAGALQPEMPGTRVLPRGVASGFLDDYSKTAIGVLLAGVGLVFLVLCANVANLVLARTSARRQEFGVCSALGASRARLVRQAFGESLLLGLAGLAGGIGLARVLLAMAQDLLPDGFLLRTLNPVALDARALVVTSLLGVVAIIGAGVPSAWIGTSTNAADSLRLTARGGSESRAGRAWMRGLLVGEVALASALLVGAGVLVASFVSLATLDPGLDLRGVTTAWMSLPATYFPDRPARAGLTETLEARMRALPGVSAIALSDGVPPDGGGFSWGTLQADHRPPAGGETTVFQTDAGPGFFSVYGIALVDGRGFVPGDDPHEAVVSERLAHLLWPNQSAVGHEFKFDDEKTWHHVVGVSREVRSVLSDPRDDLPEYYAPLASAGGGQVMLGLRCAGPCPTEPVIRAAVRAVSGGVLINRVQPLDDAYFAQFARPRAAAGLALAFALISLLAAAAGVFSLLTYVVGRRRREFGIRAAMGASPREIRRLVVRDGLVVAGLGLTSGAALAWALSRALASLEFGVTMASPIVWLAVAAVIGGATMFAAWRPAVHAARVDPLSLLRDA